MDSLSLIREKRTLLLLEIEKQEKQLESDKKRLEAYDLVLKEVSEYAGEERMGSISDSPVEIEYKETPPFYLPDITEDSVFKQLTSIGGFVTTINLTNKLFLDIPLSAAEFNKYKLEVSTMLTRLKLRGKVERVGPPKKSEWRALPDPKIKVKSWIDIFSEPKTPPNSGVKDNPLNS